MPKFYIHILINCLLISISGFSQTEKKLLRKGNDAYFGGKPVEAVKYFSNSVKEKPDYFKANFNLGDALYKTAEAIKAGKVAPPNKRMTKDSAANLVYEQAAQQFEVVAKSISNADTIQRAWHNYGNAKLKQKSFEDAILGYKKALKLNPKDEDTRYNLAYAQRELKKQQDQQKKNDKDKKDDKKKDGDKPEDKKNQGEKDKKDINNQNDKEKQEAQQPQMSKEQAEQMLNALKNSEQKMQSLRKKKGESGQKVKVEKDW